MNEHLNILLYLILNFTSSNVKNFSYLFKYMIVYKYYTSAEISLKNVRNNWTFIDHFDLIMTTMQRL